MIAKYLSVIILSILLMTTVSAQTIRINEVSSSNSLYFDEDGDTPDWIELYNFGSQTISLNNWTLSDDIQDLGKWAFPNLSLTPEQYLLIWASSKDRLYISCARSIVNQGDIFQYLIPTSEPNPNWKNLDFDDSNWLQGGSGFGYDDGDDETITPDGTLSVYLRKPFNISDLQSLNSRRR